MCFVRYQLIKENIFNIHFMCQTCQEVPKIQITNNKISQKRERKTNENI